MISSSKRNNVSNSKISFTRSEAYQITGVLLAMLIAALVGNHVALIATKQMVDMFARFLVGIFIAFLVGISVGFVFKKLWDSVQRRYVR